MIKQIDYRFEKKHWKLEKKKIKKCIDDGNKKKIYINIYLIMCDRKKK